ncbi:MAG: VirB8/TrbF family protein [Acetobacteraceae bacterium]
MNPLSTAGKIAPWRAQPLAEAAKSAKFRQVMDLNAERVILGRSAVVAGWSVGAVGAVMLAASVAGWMMFLPLKTTEVRFFLVDKSTGIIEQPVGLADAPRLFGEAVAEQYLKRYVTAREEWVPQMDERDDHIAKLMSTPAEQLRYEADRNLSTSPIRAVGPSGHVSIDNFRFHALAVGKDGTHRYLVQFDRTVWRDGFRDRPLPEPWSATVDFQWHPAVAMTPADRVDNPGGFQALAYSASPDTPELGRQ